MRLLDSNIIIYATSGKRVAENLAGSGTIRHLADLPMRPVAIGRNYEQLGIMQSLRAGKRDFVDGRRIRPTVQEPLSLHN
jgi:hypothetical protein